MNTIRDELEQRVVRTIAAVTGTQAPAIMKQTADPRFGDYQINGVMAVAKSTKKNPVATARAVAAALDLGEMCEPPQVAGPGFINLTLKPAFIATRLRLMAADPSRLGMAKAQTSEHVVVDFSSPNVAKEMHVGHLRSTIIGDCLCRLLEFEGHRVTRQNHIGDWGTQFGMLIAYLRQKDADAAHAQIADLERFYREAKRLFDEDPGFADQSRRAVVALQGGDPGAVAIWQRIVQQSRCHYQPVYEALGIRLDEADERGESFYNGLLPAVVRDLKAAGLARESDGAVCVFPEGFKTKDDEPLPFIVQKSDGAFLYATTDLAAIRFRVNELKADRIVYVTDARQKLHFEMLFATARKAGWAPEAVDLCHVTFGSVLGEDGTPLKTRSGESVKLKALLDEAVERARAVVEQKNPDLPAEQKDQIARAVGIGAVKYADYSNNRTSDYVFSFDRMLAMEGNTAPYMQYAYARIRSIGRKASDKGVNVAAELAELGEVSLTEPDELALAKHLIRYPEAIQAALADYRPNCLTAYLYDLSQRFSGFYTNCPVLTAGLENRPTRLLLCDLTARVIRQGLDLLGIAVIDQM